MLADTAVAANPEDDRYQRPGRRPQRCCRWSVGLPIIADEHVDPEFGTGALKITPGHDPDDFDIGRAPGLEQISVIGEDGLDDRGGGGEVRRADRRRGARRGGRGLRAEGRLRAEQPYGHSVPFSERSGERIEPLISLQWVCRMDELAAPAIEWSSATRSGSSPTNAGLSQLDGEIRPWCVSRQLWWGHQIPVVRPGGEEVVAESAEEAAGAAAEQRDGPRSLARETDVLDTWFSSALWPFATLGWPDDTPIYGPFIRPLPDDGAGDHLPLGRSDGDDGDRVRRRGPLRDVYVHPVVQAPDGRRMSKSLGTGINRSRRSTPGAGALRFRCSRSPPPRTSATRRADPAGP